MTNSIVKGKAFEREAARILSEATSAVWVRVPNSGGLSTSGQTTDRRFKGDLYSDNPLFSDIVAECKCRKDPITLNEIGNPKSEFSSWLRQTIDESKTSFWLMMFSWNRAPVYLACPVKDSVFYANIKSEIHQLVATKFDNIATIIFDGQPISVYRERKHEP